MISYHGMGLIYLTDLKLNSLVTIRVESLRETGKPLFTDTVEALGLRSRKTEVYRSFKLFGDGASDTFRGIYH